MKLSLSLIQKLLDGQPLPSANPEEIIERIGAQLGEVEDALNLEPFYKNIILVKVISSNAIVGSDHLSACLIDDKGKTPSVERNAEGLISVVCGAPNVHPGMVAAWIPPGSVVPSSIGDDPLILGVRKIMGTTSNGMLASAKELAISGEHDGIVELTGQDYGAPLSDVLGLNDWVIGIENKMFTHRPDLFGQLGIAREVFAIFNKPFKSPSWYSLENKLSSSVSGSLSVDNQLADSGCPRFMAVTIANLKVQPSPLWLQSYLARLGIRPVNSLVDVTNYVMIVTGQPLHAYDASKISSSEMIKLQVRNAFKNEKLRLLDEREIELGSEDIVIANDEQAIGLGGVMGGGNSEIDAKTTKVVLECASFDMYRIRRSALAHGIASEAVTRFTKGQSPLQCPPILAFAYSLIKDLCPGAELASEVADTNSALSNTDEVSVELRKVKSYLGMQLKPDQMVKILANAEITATTDQAKLTLKVPFWRTDLNEPVDVIEEIARLYGYDNLPPSLPLRQISAPSLSPENALSRLIRNTLAAAGGNEVLNYSFVDSKLIEAAGQDAARAIKLTNAISPELEYYRLSLVPSLLAKVHPNHKAGYARFAIFEINKTHLAGVLDEESLPKEEERLALVVSADNKAAKLHYQGAAYYQARAWLHYLLGALEIDTTALQLLPLSEISGDSLVQAARPFAEARSALVALDKTVGVIGEFNPYTRKTLKLPQFCAGLELDLKVLAQLRKESPRHYQPLGKFPSIYQDLTISDKGQGFQMLKEKLSKLATDNAPKAARIELLAIDAYRAQDKEETNWTFRITARSSERTLTDHELNRLIENLKQNIG